jgi:hypothetical protein
MRGLYDLWVDSAEEAYAEIALSEEFRKVYGDVVNAQTRVRSQIQQEVERVGTDLGMPTRTELNSVHKRLHDLRRKVNDLNPDAAVQIEALRAEVQELKQALARGQGQQASSASSSPKPATAKPVPKARAVRSAKGKPLRKHAAAVAKPRAASKQSASTFNDAISAMREVATGTAANNKAVTKKKVAATRRGDA